MGVLFNINHQTGDLSQYDSTVIDGGDLSAEVVANMSLTNSYGLNCLIDDTNAIYGVVDQLDPGTGVIRFRFYIDPNTLTMLDGDQFGTLSLLTPVGGGTQLVNVTLFKSGADYQLQAIWWTDAGFLTTGVLIITDAPHYVEVSIIQAATNISADGMYEWWVDGVSQDIMSNLDNFDILDQITGFRFGAINPNAGVGISGTIYLDELIIRDDGAEIGAVPTPAGQLFLIDHETGDLSQYDATVIDGGDLSVTVAAALGGSVEGLNLLIDDATAIYGIADQLDPGTGVLRFRFYIDPNTLTIGDGDNFLCFIAFVPTNFLWIRFAYAIATGYSLVLVGYDDAGATPANDSELITDAPHFVEVQIIQAATDVSSDGSYEWWIDGVSKGVFNNVDNFDIFASLASLRIGAVSFIDAGTSGTFFLDEFTANDDGSPITIPEVKQFLGVAPVGIQQIMGVPIVNVKKLAGLEINN